MEVNKKDEELVKIFNLTLHQHLACVYVFFPLIIDHWSGRLILILQLIQGVDIMTVYIKTKQKVLLTALVYSLFFFHFSMIAYILHLIITFI